jgi:hypothetical protein
MGRLPTSYTESDHSDIATYEDITGVLNSCYREHQLLVAYQS